MWGTIKEREEDRILLAGRLKDRNSEDLDLGNCMKVAEGLEGW